VIELVVIAGAIGALWPRIWWFAACLGFIGLSAGPRLTHGCCFRGVLEIENPFHATQLIITVLLCLAAWRWRRVRPAGWPALRRLALYAALVTVLCTVAWVDGAETYDALDFARVALASSIVLLACLVLEVRFHVPSLPTATARAGAPRLDRTGS
jgi:hypothetical protein